LQPRPVSASGSCSVTGTKQSEAGAAQLVSGTLRRGGARFGTAVFVGLAALVLGAVAWVPVAGYLEAVLLPAVAARLRRSAPERYAGLRSLARD
jgi:hypothetical protein